ncbi:DUF559 domain-containing protein [Pseudonocardia phyllosphaerae]|uniref:DUF559 domain-containing protein n=1 Tax=Pseudonocardia phyllosphaerae TaxID=3390502 RepID=UPI003979B2E2
MTRPRRTTRTVLLPHERSFRGSTAVTAGRLTKSRLRGPRFRRLFPDIYVHADVEATPLVRAHAAAQYVEPFGGAACGYSAAELLGASCGPRDAPAEVVVPHRFRSRTDLVVRRGVAGSAGYAQGVLVTDPLRTAWDLARRLEGVEAVVAVDALGRRDAERPVFTTWPEAPPPAWVRDRSRVTASSPGFDPAELLLLRGAHPGARGAAGIPGVVALADPRAGSPQETRLRLLLVLAGLPSPAVQHWVRPPYGRDVHFDLAYPEALLAIEYDGGDHDDELDRDRDVRTSALGWHTLRFTNAGLPRTPDRTVHLVRSLRERRLGTARSVRGT